MALVPREVAYPLSTPWSTGRCCRSIFRNFVDWLLWVCPPARDYEKMTGLTWLWGLEKLSRGLCGHGRVLY